MSKFTVSFFNNIPVFTDYNFAIMQICSKISMATPKT